MAYLKYDCNVHLNHSEHALLMGVPFRPPERSSPLWQNKRRVIFPGTLHTLMALIYKFDVRIMWFKKGCHKLIRTQTTALFTKYFNRYGGVDLHNDSKGHVCTRNNMLLIQMVKWYAKYSAKEFICIVFNQFNMSVNWPLICAFNIYCILLIYLSSYFYMRIQILNSSSVISHQSNSCH